jgi:hypothetical protein
VGKKFTFGSSNQVPEETAQNQQANELSNWRLKGSCDEGAHCRSGEGDYRELAQIPQLPRSSRYNLQRALCQNLIKSRRVLPI